ncbi:hypothetical protein DCO58_11865 [Helicobacter saguini]|uniref:Uncharacterized protein n=1 Tax=Helicobacter saguini TaxID=1548018 RepID=A0A347VQA7_9HELI|nr:hypothetical protein [Helicobacter saguini]MWV61015.1 hypothetical protein [Helicobacter saguini]MWV68316.1 hypothetical protein [Helicobacter saguini]MWV70219.1 hypothetical protein [Helicobacter saguini]MWV72122.1 hypothetical protein [Helicobacter saguini]TLD91625.1 hypothetical protein LS64_011575 [Helicobacter saguini]
MKNLTKDLDFKNLSQVFNKLSSVDFFKAFIYKVKNRFYEINYNKFTFKLLGELKFANDSVIAGFKEFSLLYKYDNDVEFKFLNLRFYQVDLEYLESNISPHEIDFLQNAINCINEMENVTYNPFNENVETAESVETASLDSINTNLESKDIESKTPKIKRKILKKKAIAKLRKSLQTKCVDSEKRKEKRASFKAHKRAYLRQKTLDKRNLEFRKEMQKIMENENLSIKEARKKAESNINLAILLGKIA